MDKNGSSHAYKIKNLKNLFSQPLEHLKDGCTGLINKWAFCFNISVLIATWRSRISNTHCTNCSSNSTAFSLGLVDLTSSSFSSSPQQAWSLTIEQCCGDEFQTFSQLASAHDVSHILPPSTFAHQSIDNVADPSAWPSGCLQIPVQFRHRLYI